MIRERHGLPNDWSPSNYNFCDNITINKNTNELNIDTKIDNIIDFTTSIIDSFLSMSERKHMTDK
jgi:hypothetical protein